MLLVIDNYDSFTYNVVQYLGELGANVVTHRNDEIEIEDIEKLNPAHIVLSPGPCTPDKAGISMAVIKEFAGKIPLLGICLGHQSIAQVYGADIVRADKVMHGKTSPIYHSNSGVFSGLNCPFQAARYHSLVIDPVTLPDCFEVTAWTQNENGSVDNIMGIRHLELALEGIQFHPESIFTEHGYDLLKNFLKY